MRLPLPWICVAAILGTLIASRKVEEAVAVLLSFLMYLLPSERDTLTPTQLVPPAPSGGDTYRLWGIILAPLKGTRPGKTGQWDEALLMVSCPWLHGTLLTLFRRAPSNRRVWRFFFKKGPFARTSWRWRQSWGWDLSALPFTPFGVEVPARTFLEAAAGRSK